MECFATNTSNLCPIQVLHFELSLTWCHMQQNFHAEPYLKLCFSACSNINNKSQKPVSFAWHVLNLQSRFAKIVDIVEHN